MKKENVIGKILINSLLGFPIGIMILMTIYASVYLIAGENVFIAEITQLKSIETLVFQLTTIGCAYYLFFILIGAITYLNKINFISDNFLVEHPYKSILIILLIIVLAILIFSLLTFKVFSENISTMNIIAFVIIFTMSGICLCIKSVIERGWIKEINQKLKERNN